MITKNKKDKMRERFEFIKEELNNPIKKAVRMQKISNFATSILRAVIIFGLAFIILFPIVQQFAIAIRNPIDINNPLVQWIPENPDIVNFKIAGTILDYWRSLFNNIKVSAICTILQVVCTSLAGYAFARLRFKGSEILFICVLLTLIVPPQAVSLSRMLFFENFDIFGIIKALTGTTLRMTGVGKDYVLYITSATGQGIRAALFVYIFRQFFRGIPIELEESAQIDGAGIIRTFWSVMLPNARGAIITCSLFAFVWQWNDVYYTQLYKISGEAFPMMSMRLVNGAESVWTLMSQVQFSHLKDLVGDEVNKNPLFSQTVINTASLMMMLPLLIAYLFVQRLFIEGVERSGIVG